MLVSPDSSSTQGWVSVVLTSTASAGDTVEIVADDGTVVATATVTKDAQSVVYSSADITAGSSYSVTVDGTDAGTVTAGEAAAGSGFGGGGMGHGRPTG